MKLVDSKCSKKNIIRDIVHFNKFKSKIPCQNPVIESDIQANLLKSHHARLEQIKPLDK